jgi:hypothetical protein
MVEKEIKLKYLFKLQKKGLCRIITEIEEDDKLCLDINVDVCFPTRKKGISTIKTFCIKKTHIAKRIGGNIVIELIK